MIARRMAKIDSSGIRKVFDLAARLEDPVNLSIGQPDFDVPSPVREAAKAAIDRGFNKYTPTQGTAELREAVAEFLRRTKGYEPEALFITSGVSGGLLLAFLVLFEPGDEVLIPDPYFVMYKHLVNLTGATPVFVDTYPDFRVTADRVEAHITPRTKALVLNSPCNPTGAVLGRADLEEVADLARRRGLLIISDEIYDAFVYDGPYVSAAPLAERALLLGGFSKSHAMTGWRLGYAAGPKDIIGEMVKLQQFSFVCAPSFAQAAGVTALAVDTTPFRDEYRRKRDLVCDGLQGRFEIQKPGGAFYVFPKVPWGTGTEFVSAAIRQGLLIIPGNVFSERDTHFRISYAAPDETLRRGVDILNRLAEEGPRAPRT